MKMRTTTVQVLGAVTMLALAFVAFVGVADTPWARPMLGWMLGMPGCPIGAELDDAARARAREKVLAALPGPEPARSRRVFDGQLHPSGGLGPAFAMPTFAPT